jgi:subtilisin family serine protease
MKRHIFAFLAIELSICLLISFGRASVDDKIDEKIRNNVIIVCKTQLLEPPNGFDEFCKENAERKRSELRREIITKLKNIANKDQPSILKALGSASHTQRLWIVNAIMVNLTLADIRKAAKLENVKYIYLGGPNRPGGKRGTKTISTIIKPEKQEPFTTEGKKIPWNLEMIGAAKAWQELKVTGDGIVVAMLDTGVNYNHEDLQKNIWINLEEIPNNKKDDDDNGYVDDYYGYDFFLMTPEIRPNPRRPVYHGSVTSCIVAGDGTGGTITGVAPRAKIMPLKGPSYFAALAYQYALENGADVLNMSFSLAKLGNARGLWRMMSDHAVCAGLVLVSGAGNYQQQLPIPEQIRIPEGIPSVICAGGVDQEMDVPHYCSIGPVEWSSVKFFNDYPLEKGGLMKPDVCGFPQGYPVILPSQPKGYVDPNDKMWGNSFSSPHISGAAALVLSANPELLAWRVKEILEMTAADIGKPGKDPRTGSGLVNAYEAVKNALSER